MLKASLLTLSAVFVSAAATAAPATQASTSTAPRQVQVADATQPAGVSTVTPAAPAAPALAVAPKKICKQLPSSYSHTTKRVCLTKEEWKQVDELSQD
jgi:ABC-type oligopeptide transport system substrate-binding subunit